MYLLFSISIVHYSIVLKLYLINKIVEHITFIQKQCSAKFDHQ